MEKALTFLLFSTLIFLIGCNNDDDDTPAIADDRSWQLDERFLLETKVQYNSYATEDNLYFLGRIRFSDVSLENDVETVTQSSIRLGFDTRKKMPISSKIFLLGDDHRLGIYRTEFPVTDQVNLSYDLRRIDPQFNQFEFPPFFRSDAMVINSKNECLIPYSTDGHWNLLWMQIEIKDISELGRLDTVSTKIFREPSIYTHTNSLHVAGDEFFISRFDGTYRINEAQELSKVADAQFTRMFTLGQTSYAVSETAAVSQIFIGDQNGNWNQLGNIDRNFSFLKYVPIADQLIGFNNSQLFLIEEAAGGFDITELDNEGLDGNEINSLALFNGRVYASTFSGVFSKAVEDFFEAKTDEE